MAVRKKNFMNCISRMFEYESFQSLSTPHEKCPVFKGHGKRSVASNGLKKIYQRFIKQKTQPAFTYSKLMK